MCMASRRRASSSPSVAAIARRRKAAEGGYILEGVRRHKGARAAAKQQSAINMSSVARVSFGPYTYIVRQPGRMEVAHQDGEGEAECKRQHEWQSKHKEEKSWGREQKGSPAILPCGGTPPARKGKTPMQKDRGEADLVEWISPVVSQRQKNEAVRQGMTMSPSPSLPSPQSVMSEERNEFNNGAMKQFFTPSPLSQSPRGTYQMRAGIGVSSRSLVYEEEEPSQMRNHLRMSDSLPWAAYRHHNAREGDEGRASPNTHRKSNQKPEHIYPLNSFSSLRSEVGVEINHGASNHCVTQDNKRSFPEDGVSLTRSHERSNRESLDTLEWGNRLWRGIEKDEHCMYRWLADRGLTPNDDVFPLHVFNEYLKNKTKRLERDYNHLFWSTRQDPHEIGSLRSQSSSAARLRETDNDLRHLDHPYGVPFTKIVKQKNVKKQQRTHSSKKCQDKRMSCFSFQNAGMTVTRSPSVKNVLQSRGRSATPSTPPFVSSSRLFTAKKSQSRCATQVLSTFYTGRLIAPATTTSDASSTTTSESTKTLKTMTDTREKSSGLVDIAEHGFTYESSPFLSLTSRPEEKRLVVHDEDHHQGVNRNEQSSRLQGPERNNRKGRQLSPLKAEIVRIIGEKKQDSDMATMQHTNASSAPAAGADISFFASSSQHMGVPSQSNALFNAPFNINVADVKDTFTQRRLRSYQKQLEKEHQQQQLLFLQKRSPNSISAQRGINVLPVTKEGNNHSQIHMKNVEAGASKNFCLTTLSSEPFVAPSRALSPHLRHTGNNVDEACVSPQSSVSPMPSPSLNDEKGVPVRGVVQGVGGDACKLVCMEDSGKQLIKKSDVATSWEGGENTAHTSLFQRLPSKSSRYISPTPEEAQHIFLAISAVSSTTTSPMKHKWLQERPRRSPSLQFSPRIENARSLGCTIPSEDTTSPAWSVGSNAPDSNVPCQTLEERGARPSIRPPPLQNDLPTALRKKVHPSPDEHIPSSGVGRVSPPSSILLPDRHEAHKPKRILDLSPKVALFPVPRVNGGGTSKKYSQRRPKDEMSKGHIIEPGSVVFSSDSEEEKEVLSDRGGVKLRGGKGEEPHQKWGQQHHNRGSYGRFSPYISGRPSFGATPRRMIHPSSWVVDLNEVSFYRSNSSGNATAYGDDGLVVVNGNRQNDRLRNSVNSLFVRLISNGDTEYQKEVAGGHSGGMTTPRSHRFGLRGTRR